LDCKKKYLINMFIPRKQKFKKQQKGKSFNRIEKLVTLNNLNQGHFGLKTLHFCRISSVELAATYKLLKKLLKKEGKVILAVFPQTPITKKPIEVRMGKGKGNVNCWVARVKTGTILFKIQSKQAASVTKALDQVKKKLSVKTQIIFKL